MYAIIKTSGKQFKVESGAVLEINRIDAEPGETITLADSVLMVQDGETVHLGTPTVPGATVTLEVKEHFRGPKLIVFKMKRRKRYRVKKGHRQDMTKVVVKDIALA
ncbi:MAG: 50S ribosomal protein L21 [Lentisphaerae bacterium]|jgi:large subunit ribosomal protein L21|nr:50S ribosomal protein L21 [Lentisphaerota bacterium]